MKLAAMLIVLTSLVGCATAPAVVTADFDKTGQEMSITVIAYKHMPDLLKAYNATRAPSYQYPHGESIDGFAVFSQKGLVCTIHVYKAPMSNVYNNYLGHEMRHCLEGNWH